MKIKIDKLKIVDEQLNVEIENINFEITIDELNKLNEEKKYEFPGLNPGSLIEKKELHYTSSVGVAKKFKIEINDEVEFLPSDDCVVNTDTIKYDEKIDGKKGKIVNIDVERNKIVVDLNNSQRIFAHPHWLKYIK